MQVSVVIARFVLLVGCSARQQQKPWSDPTPWRPGTPVADGFVYPDDSEKILNEAQKQKLRQIRSGWRPVQLSTRYDADPTLRDLYLDWYGKGYTFFEATGMQFLPTYSRAGVASQQAKEERWAACGQPQADRSSIR
jgi:hypothetical protein